MFLIFQIHDTTYGGSSDDEDFFNVYHQSAAANALLYVGLGTVAIGSVIFFVGTGEKGFKTLELRLIGPTLIACGLLCCLIRVLLCACPSTCLKRRKKTRLKNVCPHNSRYPMAKVSDRNQAKFVPIERSTSLQRQQKKKVSIAAGNPVPSTSTMNFPDYGIGENNMENENRAMPKPQIPIITIPDFGNLSGEESKLSRDDSLIELQNLELNYDLQSVSSNESDTVIEIETKKTSKHTRTRETANSNTGEASADDVETCLSVVIERSDNSECSYDKSEISDRIDKQESEKVSHSGIVLSPLQLGQ